MNGRRSPVIPEAVLITGPVGVGKTTAAFAVSERLRMLGIPHAVIDLNTLSWCYPPSIDDPYRDTLVTENLRCVWPNYAANGVGRLIAVRAIETEANLERLKTTVPGMRLTVVRLRASVSTLAQRIAAREPASERLGALARAEELARIMDRNAIGDAVIETDGLMPDQVASQILKHLSWR